MKQYNEYVLLTMKMIEQMMAYIMVQKHMPKRELRLLVTNELVVEKLDLVELVHRLFVDKVDGMDSW